MLTRLALFATDGLELTYAVDVDIGIDHSLRNVPIDTTQTAEKIFQLYFKGQPWVGKEDPIARLRGFMRILAGFEIP